MQIRINNNLIGIVGLRDVLETLARDDAHRAADEVGKEILNRVSAKNYIPAQAKEQYIKAFIREFRKHVGERVDDPPPGGLRVLVLGPGCAQCGRLEMDVREAMAEMKLPGELLHVTDQSEIAKYGVMGLPALVINDKVVWVGATPHRNKIMEWLRSAGETPPFTKE